MLALPPEQWVVLPSPALCLLCCLLRIYHLCWVSIRLYLVSTVATQFTGLDCTLLAQCDVYMRPVLSLHYYNRKVLCMSSVCCTTASTVCCACFCSCCTTASVGCYVCLACVALLPAQGAIYVLFVLHYYQHSVQLLNTASAVCCH